MLPDLFIPGTELPELTFSSFLDWFIHITDIKIHWKNEPTYIISQFSYLVGGLATIIHAFHRGGRLKYLWFATMLYGLAIESICYVHPDVDNFWHSQTPIIFLGRRLPLHIILLYPCFIYQSSVAAAKMRLPKWSEPLAVGLLVVLIDIPYDIISIKFLHWTWHDTDPNIFDRHYWVPWNSYYFHATFAASFTFWFHFLREKLCTSDGKWIADKRISRELLCTFLAGLLGGPGGILLFIAIYHPLHDIYNIHSEVIFFTIFAIFLVIIWASDRQSDKKHPSLGSMWYTTCGVPFTNRPEYILMISLFCGLASVIFYNLHFCSEGDSVFNYKFAKHKITAMKKKNK